MSKIQRKTFLFSQKVLNMFVVILMVFQPVSVPARYVVAQESDPVEEVSVEKESSDEENEKEKPTEEETVKEETVAEKEASEEFVEEDATVDEPIVEEVVVIEKAEDAKVIENPVVENKTEDLEESLGSISEQITEKAEDATETSEGVVDEMQVVQEETTQDVEIVEDGDVWKVSKDNKKAETNKAVELDTEYKFPGNEDVVLKFTRLPENSGTLSIEEIKLTKDQIIELEALSNKAYDITSTMENGSFEYEMSLPIPKDVSREDISVIYAENVEGLENAEKVEESKMEIKEDKVDLKLDHFTIFTLVKSPANSINAGWINPNNVFSSDNSRAIGDSNMDVVVYDNFNLSVPTGSVIEGIEVQVEGYTGGARQAEVSISWDGGLNYSAGSSGVKITNLPGTNPSAENTIYLGGSSDLWGQSWSSSNFSDSNFRLKLHATSGYASSLYIDYMGVKIYYTQSSSLFCGDGIIGGTEQCDGSNLGNWPTSDFSCTDKCELSLIDNKVKICHAADSQSSPYVVNEPDKSGDVSGHDYHDGDIWYSGIANNSWGDIIPPFHYIGGSFAGQNWTTQGQAIWENNCEIPNPNNGTLKIIKKVINDSGGTADANAFGINTSAGTLSFGAGVAAGTNTLKYTSQTISVAPGSYTLRENDIAGYSEGTWSCTGATPTNTSISHGAVTVPDGGNVVCTIVNNDNYGTIKIIKKVINDSGGTADVNAFGINTSSGALSFGAGVADGTNTLKYTSQTLTVVPGSYTLRENDIAGYSEGTWSCTGGTVTNNSISSGAVTVPICGHVVCTITNNDIAPTLTLVKQVINDNGGEAVVSDFTLKADDTIFTSGVSQAVTAGEAYMLSETGPSGYSASAWVCSGGSQNGSEVTLSEGQSAICTITNDDVYGKIIVDKITNPTEIEQLFDFNLTGGPSLIDRQFQLADQTTPYDSGIILPGSYSVVETNIEGWNLTSAVCQKSGIFGNISIDPSNIVLGEGETITCEFTNEEIAAPELTIEKFNDQWPVVQSTGDVVDYTITVNAYKSRVNDVVVEDLMPEGFSFRNITSVRKNGVNLAVADPAYASPGTWSLGDMEDGDEVVIKFAANIGNNQDPGTYKDLAWASGTDANQAIVYATNEDATTRPAGNSDTGIIGGTDNFVGTQIALAVPGDPVPVVLDEDTDTEIKRKTRYVVGSALPATGTQGPWTAVGLGMLILGGALLILRKKNMIKKGFIAGIVLGVALAGISFQNIAKANGLISVRMEEPADFVNSPDFKIGFVVLDINGGSPTVRCEVNDGGGFDSFPAGHIDYTSISGGSSGDCLVDESVMTTDGTYSFRVVVNGSINSNEESVELDSGAPATPQNYDRDSDSCNISFRTADDGITSKVEMYRSEDRAFTANASTLTNTMNIGPNTNGSMTDPNGNCDDYLYAIRAVSASGAGSGFVGDEDVNVETETRTRTIIIPGETAVGAIPVAGEGAIVEGGGSGEGIVEGGIDEEGIVAGAQTEGAEIAEGTETTEQVDGQEEETSEGIVLGEQTENDGLSGGLGFVEKYWPWLVIIFGALLAWYYGTFRRKSREGGRS